MKEIQIISLRNAIVRRSAVAAEFERSGLDFEFFDAVDGALGKEAWNHLVRADLAEKVLGRGMTDGEIGCALSHAFLLQAFLAEEHMQHLFVFEDDVRLGPVLGRVLDALKQTDLPESCLIVFPSGFDFYPRWRSGTGLMPGVRLYENVLPTWGAYGMYLTRGVAQSLLTDFLPVVVPADYVGRLYGARRLKVMGVWPPVISHPHHETNPRHSQIGTERALAESASADRGHRPHEWGSVSALNRFSRMIKQWL